MVFGLFAVAAGFGSGVDFHGENARCVFVCGYRIAVAYQRRNYLRHD